MLGGTVAESPSGFTKDDVTKALVEILETTPKHRLDKLRLLPANALCCDCGTPGTAFTPSL